MLEQNFDLLQYARRRASVSGRVLEAIEEPSLCSVQIDSTSENPSAVLPVEIGNITALLTLYSIAPLGYSDGGGYLIQQMRCLINNNIRWFS